MPYNPQINYRGDAYIAQGNQAAWSALASFIHGTAEEAKQKRAAEEARQREAAERAARESERAAEEAKREHAAGQAADYFTKADPDAFTKLGITKEQWGNLGSSDKAAAVEGLMKQLTVQEMTERLKNYNLRTTQQQKSAEDDSAVSGFLRDYFSTDGDHPKRAATAMQNLPPNVSGSAIAGVLDSLSKYGANPGNEPYFAPGKAPELPQSVRDYWEQVVTGPNTSQLVPKPGTSQNLVPLVQDGTVVGYGTQSPRTGSVTPFNPPGKLATRDALMIYNQNQQHLASLQQKLNALQQNPDMARVWNPDTLRLQIQDVESQQTELRRVWGQALPKTAQPDRATPPPQQSPRGNDPMQRVPEEKRSAVQELQNQLRRGRISVEEFKAEIGNLGL